MAFDFASILGVPPPLTQQPVPTQPASYSQMVDPQAAAMAEAARRANIGRAIGMAGAQLVQPMGFGQTPLGQLGQAFNVGNAAFDAGNAAQLAQEAAMRKEVRTQAESDANVEATRAGTKQKGAVTEGVQEDNRLKAATFDSAVSKARGQADLLLEQVENARTKGKVDKIALSKLDRINKILETIPEGTIRDGLIAEYDKKIADTKLALSNAFVQDMTGKLRGAQAQEQILENSDMASMDPNERLTMRKASKRGLANSAQVQMMEWFEGKWRRGNPQLPTETKEQYEQRAAQEMTNYAKQAKGKPDDEHFLKWAELFGTGDYARDRALYEASKGRTPPGSTPGGAATGVQKWGKDKNGNPVPLK